MNSSRQDALVAVVLLLVATAVPFLFGSRYVIGQLTLSFIWALVAVQWNLVFGVAGIFSLAQMAVFGLGGYATALLVLHAGWGFLPAAVAACVICGLFGLAVGAASFRLKGAYVALLTLSVSQALFVLIVTDTDCFVKQGASCLPFSGGARGLSDYGDFGFRSLLPFSVAHWGNYFLALVSLALSMGLSFWLIRSPIGLAFRALRDNPVLAAGRGVSRMRYQLIVFSVSAVFTGLAGVLYAAHIRVMGPNVLGLPVLLLVLCMMVVGGLGTRWGPLLGAAAIGVLDELLREIPEWRGAILGSILVLSVVVLPGGLAGIDLTRRRRASSAPALSRSGTASHLTG